MLERQALLAPLKPEGFLEPETNASAPRGSASRGESARRRSILVVAIVVTLGLGLGSRAFRASLPSFLSEYAGDALYATLVFFLAAFMGPRARGDGLALVAFLFSAAVELSQTSQAAWLVACRSTKLGRLVLGTTFVWSDFPCYAVGALLGFAVDRAIFGDLRSRFGPRDA